MKMWFVSLLLILSFNANAANNKKGVSLQIELSPIGSFTLETKRIKGKVIANGDKYTAKELYVKVKNLKSGISLRDNHVQVKYLLKKKFPKISVTDLVAKNGKGKAFLTIKSIKKEISFKYKIIKNKLMKATFSVKLSDYGITGISYKGVGVEDDVSIIGIAQIKK